MRGFGVVFTEPEGRVNKALILSRSWTCLNKRSRVGVVPRAHTIRVEYFDEFAELRTAVYQGFPARIVQHEIDHLHGCLCMDRMLLRMAMNKEHCYAENWPERMDEEAVTLFAANNLRPLVESGGLNEIEF